MPPSLATVIIRNRLGLHARPAMAFVDAAMAFKSSITVRRTDAPPEEAVDGKSIMQMMMLAATQGTSLELCADGDDAPLALTTLTGLVERGFDEE